MNLIVGDTHILFRDVLNELIGQKVRVVTNSGSEIIGILEEISHHSYVARITDKTGTTVASNFPNIYVPTSNIAYVSAAK